MSNITTDWICGCNRKQPLITRECPLCKHSMPVAVRHAVYLEVLRDERLKIETATVNKHSARWVNTGKIMNIAEIPIKVIAIIAVAALLILTVLSRNDFEFTALFETVRATVVTLYRKLSVSIPHLFTKPFGNVSDIFRQRSFSPIFEAVSDILSALSNLIKIIFVKILGLFGLIRELFS